MFLRVGERMLKGSKNSDEMTIESSIVSIPEDSELVQKLRKKYKEKPPFIMATSKRTARSGERDMVRDVIQEMLTWTKAEQKLFGAIEAVLDFETNVAEIAGPSTKFEQNQLYKAYKLLRSKDVIRRIQPRMYMISPDLIIPGDEYLTAKERYSKLK